jgi:hypothetical protein
MAKLPVDHSVSLEQWTVRVCQVNECGWFTREFPLELEFEARFRMRKHQHEVHELAYIDRAKRSKEDEAFRERFGCYPHATLGEIPENSNPR